MTGLNSREQSSQCRVRWLLIAICSERPVWCRLFRVYPLDSCKNHSKSWSLDECTGASFYHNTIVALMVSDGNLMSLKSDIEPSRWCNFSWFNDTLYHWEEWYQYLKGPATNQLQCSVSHSVLNNMYQSPKKILCFTPLTVETEKLPILSKSPNTFRIVFWLFLSLQSWQMLLQMVCLYQ